MNTDLLNTLITTRDEMFERILQTKREAEEADRELTLFKQNVLIQVILPKMEVTFSDGKTIVVDSLEKIIALQKYAERCLSLMHLEISEEEFQREVVPHVETLLGEKILMEEEEQPAEGEKTG
jgi:uncharacterized protein (DUF4213/DUF364 family)